MGMNITQKILAAHVSQDEVQRFVPGTTLHVRADQTLLQDSTGTMACLQFEAMGIPRVKTELSVCYVDHNVLQTDFRNPDDHRYLRTLSAAIGAIFSPPGTGICHQLHLENFAKPGTTLIGSDSHTPTSGGCGALAIGAGGLSVALAMAGEPYQMVMPEIVQIVLTGSLQGFASAKDVVLTLLRQITVKGGIGKIFEYAGPGVAGLSVHERATIANMGAEMGLTSSIFPSDEITRQFLASMGREQDWVPLAADADATYANSMEIELNGIVPMVACPHLPDKVVPVAELDGMLVTQVAVGSCTNSSYADLHLVADLLRGKQLAVDEMLLSPGSKQVLRLLAANGALDVLLAAGVRLLECSCGPCLGIGGAPITGGVSVRTSNRNFEGRSGTPSAKVYLASPATAAMAAVRGKFTNPATWGSPPPHMPLPAAMPSIRHLFVEPPVDGKDVEIVRGPNIVPLPAFPPMKAHIQCPVLIHLGDHVTTDHIVPANSHINGLRSNLPSISEYTFSGVDLEFVLRAKQSGCGVIVAGDNYGQGSSREQAALCPRYLGVAAIFAKSFARIHRDNLVNCGIMPLLFVDSADHGRFGQGDEVNLALGKVRPGEPVDALCNKGLSCWLTNDLTPTELACIRAGGVLSQARARQTEGK